MCDCFLCLVNRNCPLFGGGGYVHCFLCLVNRNCPLFGGYLHCVW